MTHYRIRSTKETLKKIFYEHLNDACFCIDSKNISDSGICDVVVIPGTEAVVKFLKDHFIFSRIEYDDLEFNETTPPYYGSEVMGNRGLL